MDRTREEEVQMWDDEVAKSQSTIAENEREISRIKSWWESESRSEPFDSHVAYLEDKVVFERAFLQRALEKRKSL